VIFTDDLESGNVGAWDSWHPDGEPILDIFEPADGAVIE